MRLSPILINCRPGLDAYFSINLAPGHVPTCLSPRAVVMGSGDIFGAFGGTILRGGGSEVLMIPVARSVLMRPCGIMVETKSPERTAWYLRQAALLGMSQSRGSRDLTSSGTWHICGNDAELAFVFDRN